MGWGSGTEVFDAVAKVILTGEKDQKKLLSALIDALEDRDWDCPDDSRYWKHPLVREIFKEKNPEWFEEE